MTQGFCGFLLLLGGDGGSGKGAGCRAVDGPGLRFFLFFSANQDENQNIKLNRKQKDPKPP